jgi:hypothetical protein
MSTVTVEPVDAYVITYKYPKLDVVTVLPPCIDITWADGIIEFQPLVQSDMSPATDPMWERNSHRVTLNSGTLIKIEVLPRRIFIIVAST